MNIRMKSTVGAMALAILSVSGISQADDYHSRFYIDILGSHVATGSSRQADNDGGYAVGVGLPITDHINLEFSLQERDYAFDFGGRIDHRVSSLDAQFVSDPAARTTPFFMVGIGREKLESVFGADSGSNATLGLGVLSALTDHIAFRGDLRYQQGAVLDAGDLALHFGLRVLFGDYSSGSAAAAPAAAVDGDADRDGVLDSVDACPGTPYGTRVDARGCALAVDGDADGDGVRDSLDRCPGSVAGARVDAAGCEIDSDGDGVTDRLDACPGTPAGVRVDARGCSLDSDGDGVNDAQDRCPATPAGTRVDGRGCPLASVIRLEGVTFETGSSDITATSRANLDEAIATLRQNPGLAVEVAGHTDSQGDANFNRALSQRRAESVRQYLVDGGAPAEQVTARGYGEDEPVASNDDAAGRAQNRRVELRIRE